MEPYRDFPGGLVAKTLSSQCRGLGLIPGRGARFHMPQLTSSRATTKAPVCCNWDPVQPDKYREVFCLNVELSSLLVLVSIGGLVEFLENQHCLLSNLMGDSSICHTGQEFTTLPDPLSPSVKGKATPNLFSFVTCWAHQVKRHLWKCHWLLHAKWTQGVASHGWSSADFPPRGLQMRILRA